jgi:hypothetical protein
VQVRNSAVKYLKAIGKPAEQSLIKTLEDGDPNISQSAVIILGDIGDVLAIKPLCRVLYEGNPDINISARSALGKIRSRVTSEEWDKEVQEYRDSRRSQMEKERLEMEREMAKHVERRRLAVQSRPHTTWRPPAVQPQPPLVRPVVQPSPAIREGFLLRPRNMSIPLFIWLSIGRMAIACVIMSVGIRIATKIVVGDDIGFGDAWTIAFLIALITFFTRLVTAYINEQAFYVLSAIFQLGVAPFIYGRMIDYGEGPIGFAKGLLIHICSIVATFVVILGTIFLC